MDKIRIGVIGLGFGQHHVRTLANMMDAELVAVADLNPQAAGGLEAYAAKYGAKAYRDGIEMLENEALDAVSICTSPKYRAPLIEARRGRACRSSSRSRGPRIWRTRRNWPRSAAEYDATVMPAFSFRFHPAIVKLRALMDGELGPGWMLNGEYVFGWLPPADAWLWDPENGNGFFNENSCHLFDAVCYLLGDPVSVTAEAIKPLERPSEHAAAVTIRFANGAIAALTIGGIATGAFHSYPRIDVITANGQAHLTGRDHIWERLDWATRDDAAVHNVVVSPEGLGNTRYTHAFQHFFDSLRGGTPLSIGVEDGVKSVALAMAVYESARSGVKVEVKY